MNILMINHHRRFKSHFRAGILAKHLVERGHNVSVMVVSDHARAGVREDTWQGVRMIETPDLLTGEMRSGWDPWCALNRLLYLRRAKEHFDIIHTMETRPATVYPTLAYLRCRPMPWLTDWIDWWGRGGLVAERRPWWYQKLFGGLETYYEEAFRARADGLTVISHALMERAVSLGVPRDRIRWIPGGARTDLFVPLPKAEARKRVGLPADVPILMFSALDVHIDLPLVLQAFARVSTVKPQTLLVITGRGLGPMRHMVRQLGIAKGVINPGFVPFNELPTYLSCADIFLLPLRDCPANRGRWPNKIGDYMAIGRPTVTNPVGEMVHLFKEPIGRLAGEDPGAFAAEILWLLEHPDAAVAMGQRAREVAHERYSWARIAADLESFYIEVREQWREGLRHHAI